MAPSSVGLEDLTLGLNAQDSQPCGKLKMGCTVKPSLPSISPTPNASATSALFAGTKSSNQLSLAAGSPVRTFPWQVKPRGCRAHGVDYGRTSIEPFLYYDPAMSSWKMFQRYFFEGWDEFWATFQKSGTMRNGKLYQRTPLARHICGSGCFLLPTPTASMGKRGWGLSLTGRLRVSKRVWQNAMSYGYKPDPTLIEIGRA